MSAINRRFNRPQYLVAREHQALVPQRFGPPDMWPSADGEIASSYSGVFGRNLAGTEDSGGQNLPGVNGMNAENIENYPNELDLLGEADDVNGNGVFDPNLTHGNVHPHEGIFAAHYNLPGYVARDQFYQPSSVTSATQGGHIEYVPGGAVSFQQGQEETLRRTQQLWEVPNAIPVRRTPEVNTVDAPTPVMSVSGMIEDAQREAERKGRAMWALAIGATLVVGYSLWKSKKLRIGV
jgi:hypothetical protein